MSRKSGGRLAALERRLAGDAGPTEVVFLIGQDQIRAHHATLPVVATAAVALALLDAEGRAIAPELIGRHGLAPAGWVEARYGRMACLGGPDAPSPPVATLGEAVRAVDDRGYRLAPALRKLLGEGRDGEDTS